MDFVTKEKRFSILFDLMGPYFELNKFEVYKTHISIYFALV